MTEKNKYWRTRQGCPASHHGHMHRVSVCITVHGHGADAHLLGRAHHAARNLSSIGDQHLVYPSNPWTKHGRQLRVSLFFFPQTTTTTTTFLKWGIQHKSPLTHEIKTANYFKRPATIILQGPISAVPFLEFLTTLKNINIWYHIGYHSGKQTQQNECGKH